MATARSRGSAQAEYHGQREDRHPSRFAGLVDRRRAATAAAAAALATVSAEAAVAGAAAAVAGVGEGAHL